jgi:hypothetical protein
VTLTIIALCDEGTAPDTGAPCDWLETLPECPAVHAGSLLQAPSPATVQAHLTRRGWLLIREPSGIVRTLCPICGDYRRGGAA